MDTTTAEVRALYERFPYPAGAPELRLSCDAEALLGEVALSAPRRPLEVLDAGCGRGLGLVGAAAIQPDVRFTGVDLSRASLADAQASVKRMELANVRLAAVDLTTLEGLEVPPGGFDVIHSSGVVHHMADPAAGLRRLGGVLAPHGVLVLMVYARAGRERYAKVTQVIDAIAPRGEPVAERLAQARPVVTALAATHEAFAEAARVDDVEFVDRYLHVQEVSYDLEGLRQLVREAGLEVLRWCDPDYWTTPPLPNLPQTVDSDAVVAAVKAPRVFELLLVHPGNGPRAPLTAESVAQSRFRVSTEGTFELVTRCTPNDVRQEALRFRAASGRVHTLTGVLAVAGLCLREQRGAFTGAEFRDALVGFGTTGADAGMALAECFRIGMIVRLPD